MGGLHSFLGLRHQLDRLSLLPCVVHVARRCQSLLRRLALLPGRLTLPLAGARTQARCERPVGICSLRLHYMAAVSEVRTTVPRRPLGRAGR